MAATIRLAREEDAADISAIYTPIVRNTSCSFELRPPTGRDMRQRIAKTLERLPWLSCDVDGKVRGYVYANPHRVRAAYQWSVEVSVYIDEEFRQHGIARALYTSLFALLRLQGFVNAYAGISLPNDPGIRLHTSFGFEPIGTYYGVAYKHDAWHDVGWWQLRLRERTPNPEPPLDFAHVQTLPEWEAALNEGAHFLKLER